MQSTQTFYPVRATSRSVIKKRSRRISWFVIGTSFGVACSFLLTSSLTPSPDTSIQAQTASLPALTATAHIPVSTEVPAPVVSPKVEAAIQQESKPAAAIYPLALNLKTEDGDTLINILTDTGIAYEDAQSAVSTIKQIYDPKKLDIGQYIAVVLEDSKKNPGTPVIASLKLNINATSFLELSRNKNAPDGAFVAKKVNVEVERKLARAGGRIDSSLYETGTNDGIPAAILNDMISAYSYDVDFQREIQPGDNMDVLFESLKTKDGTTAGHGNLLFAELTLSGRVLKIYRYVDAFGSADYYNEKGESIRKALLRTPVNGAKITSGFGMRNHPLLGYSKMHRGVDFGAPTGTPIYAAGDGVIAFTGRKGGYGNYLRIHHNNKYDTAYAHISRFASGVAAGHKVKQGQIVAYVGSTGMSTGPHLHYEILAGNEQINPAGIKFKTGNVLAGRELVAFRKNMEKIQAQLSTTQRKTDVALNTSK